MKSLLVILLFVTTSCSTSDPQPNTQPAEAMYFPPVNSETWETKTIGELDWNPEQVQPLLDFLQQKNTKSFMVLINGRIVLEHYFNGHTATTNWYWASAGKTLTATMSGIAEQQGKIIISNKVSDYIGTGWTSLPLDKENLITNRHLLTMTSGISDADPEECVEPECLTYAADAGTRWAYHNVYVKLQDVIAGATEQTFNEYFNDNLRDKIGMNGSWINSGNNRVYWSTTRSMARFGLLMLNKGKWENEQIVDAGFVASATSTSQALNKAYGYLWWLNGRESFRLPQTQLQFEGTLIPSAPADMFMALGKNDQKLYVIPSKKMVVVRMGNAADEENFALSGFDDQLWQKISLLYN